MKRQDDKMPFMLQYEHVAWYENGEVRILDRRVYPREAVLKSAKRTARWRRRSRIW